MIQDGIQIWILVNFSFPENPVIHFCVQECAGCHKKIHDKFVLKALDVYWHEECLKCGCCDCRLGEVGQTFYTKGNLLLCKRDYLRLDHILLFLVFISIFEINFLFLV